MDWHIWPYQVAAPFSGSNAFRFLYLGLSKSEVYKTRYDNVGELKEAVLNILNTIHHNSLHKATRAVLKRARMCVQENGRHMEHLL